MSLFVAGAALGQVQASLFVCLGDVQASHFAAGAIFGEVGVSFFVAGAMLQFSIQHACSELEK